MKYNSPRLWWWIKSALVAVIIFGLGTLLAPYWQGLKPLSPIAWQIGPLAIHWYGLILAAAVGLGFWLVYRRPHFGVTADQLTELAIWLVIGGLIGARLMFVILKWPFYVDNPSEILMFGRGGLSIHGAMLGGLIAAWWYATRAKLNFWQLVDLIIPGVVLGQIVGRLGNFFNQEAFGGPTALPWKMFVAPQNRPTGLEDMAYFHPTFAYEALLNLIVLAILLRLTRQTTRPGSILAWYLILYSSVRFGVEWFRIDSDALGFFTIAQWASLGIIGLGIYLLTRHRHA